MERTYRAANGVYVYAVLLLLLAAILGWEAVDRLRGAETLYGALVGLLAAVWLICALVLVWRWGRLRIVITPDVLLVAGSGPARRVHWADVERVRELRGPAYQLSLRRLLPGPFLPHGIVRGETVLEVVARPATRIAFRRALVHGYLALRQDVLRSVPKDAQVDQHARWWRDTAPGGGRPAQPAG